MHSMLVQASAPFRLLSYPLALTKPWPLQTGTDVPSAYLELDPDNWLQTADRNGPFMAQTDAG